MVDNSSTKTNSRTVADTIVGEHQHTICGYSLLKGIGDGEPVASDRFSVGGHEWVLLFYPDGKKSSSSDHNQMYQRMPVVPLLQAQAPGRDDVNGQNQNPAERDMRGERVQVFAEAAAAAAAAAAAVVDLPGEHRGVHGAAIAPPEAAAANAPQDAPAAPAAAPAAPRGDESAAAAAAAANAVQAGVQAAGGVFAPQPVPPPLNFHVHVPPQPPVMAAMAQANRPGRRNEATNEYCALFVALIGEGKEPQGVINTTDGKVVRAFHRFTLVDQRSGRHITKGRQRADGAVKISCARQDPNARNCHGYRKFVRKSALEDPNRGFLLDDRIVIRYTIELVVSQGGALMAQKAAVVPRNIEVPPPTIGLDFSVLLHDDASADVSIKVLPGDALLSVPTASASRLEEESTMSCGNDLLPADAPHTFKAHKLVLQARSPVFRSMLSAGMSEGATGEISISDMLPDVFRALLFFIYTDQLPEDVAEAGENGMEVSVAQHLLLASDRYQLLRLRTICEKRLCDTVDVDNVAQTLMLAYKSNAEKLSEVCLTYVATNLSQVINTDDYKRLTEACPGILNEILTAVAVQGNSAMARSAPHRAGSAAVQPRPRPRIRRRDDDRMDTELMML